MEGIVDKHNINLMEQVVHWHAVFTASRAEKKVKERLDQQGIECFLPVQTVVRQWTYRKSKVTVPVIAGIIFVKVTKLEQLAVLQTKGVVSFLRLKGEAGAAVIPDNQMKDFRFLLDFSEEAVEITNENIEIGDWVQVVKGALKGWEGELVTFRGATKIALRIEMLGCALVDIPASFVKSLKRGKE